MRILPRLIAASEGSLSSFPCWWAGLKLAEWRKAFSPCCPGFHGNKVLCFSFGSGSFSSSLLTWFFPKVLTSTLSCMLTSPKCVPNTALSPEFLIGVSPGMFSNDLHATCLGRSSPASHPHSPSRSEPPAFCLCCAQGTRWRTHSVQDMVPAPRGRGVVSPQALSAVPSYNSLHAFNPGPYHPLLGFRRYLLTCLITSRPPSSSHKAT